LQLKKHPLRWDKVTNEIELEVKSELEKLKLKEKRLSTFTIKD